MRMNLVAEWRTCTRMTLKSGATIGRKGGTKPLPLSTPNWQSPRRGSGGRLTMYGFAQSAGEIIG